MRDVTAMCAENIHDGVFLLTRPMRDVTGITGNGVSGNRVSTHTPHAGRDSVSPNISLVSSGFLLTRPMRDVTAIFCISSMHIRYI